MHVRDIMTVRPRTIGPDVPVGEAARIMREHDVGVLLVVDHDTLVGLLTDRDIVVAACAGRNFWQKLSASEIMSRHPVCCRADQPLTEAAGLMGDHQLRRLPVLDHDGRLAGILSVGDIARDASERLAGEILGEIVEFR